MESFIRDIRYGVRALLKKPGITLIAVLSIAIGVSSCATVFCWIESIVLNPLPLVPQSHQLLAIATKVQSGDYITTSYSDYKDYERQNKSLTGITAFEERPLSVESKGQTQQVWAMLVTANFFDVLGIKPARGHFFQPAEQVDVPGGAPVAVLSYEFWTRYFGGNPSVIGQNIRLNRQDLTIIGVAPEGFRGTIVGLAYDVWVPLLQQNKFTGGSADWITNRKFRSLHAIARLKPDVALTQAQSEMNLISIRLSQAFHEENAGISAVLFPLAKAPDGAPNLLGPVLNVLLLATLVVLMIVCSNLANLFLVRAAEREKEISVRIALGASKGRIFRQLTAEGLILSLLAALLSVLFTFRLAGVLKLFVPPVDLPVSITPSLDPKVVLFAVLLSIVAGLVSSLAPAWRSAKVPLSDSLKEGSRGTSSHGKRNLRSVLTAAEVSLALVAMIGAGLFIKSFRNVTRIDPGFDYEHVLLVALTPSEPGHKSNQMEEFYRRVKERVKSLPSVRSVSYAELVPLGLKGGSWEDLTVGGYAPQAEENMKIYRNLVDDDYFDVMRISRVDGRFFDRRDEDKGSAVAIVNESFVRRFIKGGNPVGHVIQGWGRNLTIVGVVKDSKYASSTETPQPYLYVPFRQFAGPETGAMLHVAVNGVPGSILSSVRHEVESLNSVAYV
jgi:predicted permease